MKKKVVNTRVSNDLYETISERAKARGVTVSNLIRNLVEDSLDISGEVLSIVDKKIRSRLSGNTTDIVGYQQIILAKDVECDVCGKQLKKGATAYFAFTENGSQFIVCNESKKELESESETTPKSTEK